MADERPSENFLFGSGLNFNPLRAFSIDMSMSSATAGTEEDVIEVEAEQNDGNSEDARERDQEDALEDGNGIQVSIEAEEKGGNGDSASDSDETSAAEITLK